jgi:hypothetical protein
MDEAVVDEPMSPEQDEKIAELELKRKAARDAMLGTLAHQFLGEFNLAKAHRQMAEQRWIDDLRAYKGMYEPEIEKKLKENKRSGLFLRLTRSKIKQLSARLSDTLFPAGDKNWNIAPTPSPELDRAANAAEIAAIKVRDGGVDEEALKKAVEEIAKKKCEAMSAEMDDQLKELDYEANARRVIFSAALYGTGLIKGPLGSPKPAMRWVMTANGWQKSYRESKKPYCRQIPIWYYYPDHTATDVKDCGYEFEYIPMSKGEVTLLKKDDRFMADRIEAYLGAHPNGSSVAPEPWEQDVRNLSKDENSNQPSSNRYVVLCRWGELTGEVLAANGVPVEDEQASYEAQAWILGDTIIRLDINPFQSGSRPFKLFYFDKDESSIWGEGLASIMADTMRGVNTSMRAAIDNAAATAIPNMEVNTELLSSDEMDTDTFTAGRTWRRSGTGQDAQYPAVRVVEIPTRVNDFMTLMKLFMEMSDEVTNIPRYSGGSANGNAIAKTVGGLSMLMGQANISIKELAKQWDDGITTPFIRDLYDWNMQFNDKPSIKGDFEVVARGASSLVAKEIRSNALNEFAMLLLKAAPELAKKHEIFSEIARSLELNPQQHLKTKDEAQAEDVERQTGVAAMEAVSKIAQAIGVPPEQLVQNIDPMIARLQSMVKNQQGVTA